MVQQFLSVWSRVQHIEANEQKDLPLIWPSSVKDSHMETVGVEVTHAVSSKILEGNISEWKTLKTLMGKGKLAEHSRKFRKYIRRLISRRVGVQQSEQNQT